MLLRQTQKLLHLTNHLKKVSFLQRNVISLCHRSLPKVPIQIPQNTSIGILPVRWKYTGKGKEFSTQDEDSDSDADDLAELKEKGTNLIKCSVTSMRADLLIKNGLGLARNKVELKFYEGKIRVNGKKIPKKSFHVNVGDEIDLIKNVSPTNPDHLVIGRIEIVGVTPKEETISVLLRRYKTLIVENYEERNAYKESEA
ncbi:mitochondrial transcription rescue factor 1 [Lutzomyia longipalpis]|uniref:mitochondrial transcription rescue factor 1 n=1 Tax=Lutzomyia longipalpis TaxID=7200 RepID=UPI00248376F6|nr:mitochondrial transcription rescue factor 1 [Lutzomyia longipalpis]